MALDKQKSPAVLSCIILIKSSLYKKISAYMCIVYCALSLLLITDFPA